MRRPSRYRTGRCSLPVSSCRFRRGDSMRPRQFFLSVSLVAALGLPLALAAAGPAAAAFPGTNGKIAFFRCCPNGFAQIYVMNPDGSNMEALTDEPGTNSTGGQWSADGKKLVFVRGVCCSFDIWIMNADGSGAKDLDLDRFLASRQGILQDIAEHLANPKLIDRAT